jgi:hypothetical protein
MSELNYIFFDEYKRLDNICSDIYGKTSDNKLGVTLYLEDMDKNASKGRHKISCWVSDYIKLKRVRNIRNELAHSRNSFTTIDICSQEDIDFICQFRARLLQQTDPIALLRQENTQYRTTTSFNQQKQSQSTYTHETMPRNASGCLGAVASFVFVVACIIAFFIS